MTEDTTNGVENQLQIHGKVSYMEIPALDVEVSSAFYGNVFGWELRGGGKDHFGFTDTSGQMIGAWVTGNAVAREHALVPYIYVQGIDDVVERIKASGGEIVKPVYAEGGLWVATFRDPAGNMIGVWQAGGR